MVFRHCVDFLSLEVAEGWVDRPLADDATMLTMLDNGNISASGTSCSRAWLAPMMWKQISPFCCPAPLSSFHRNEWPPFFNLLYFNGSNRSMECSLAMNIHSLKAYFDEPEYVTQMAPKRQFRTDGEGQKKRQLDMEKRKQDKDTV